MSINVTSAGLFLQNQQTLQGRNLFSPLQISIQPIDSDRSAFIYPKYTEQGDIASGFLDYEFDSNILIPADAFSFTFAAPQDKNPYDLIKEGDRISILTNQFTIAVGIIDAVDIRVDAEHGEIVTLRGRDLLGNWADQSATLDSSGQLYGGPFTVQQALSKFTPNSTVSTAPVIFQNVNSKAMGLLGTMPEESKLSSMVGFLESLNYLIWMTPDGSLKIGQPNMVSNDGTLVADSKSKQSNVLSYRVTRASTSIPNRIVPFYTQVAQAGNQPLQATGVNNTASRPSQLRAENYFVTKAIATSLPNSTDFQALNVFLTNPSLGGTNLQGLAARKLARYNMLETQVEVEVPGHINPSGLPWKIDTNYNLYFDRASLSARMYLYAVKYKMDIQRGQITILNFCPQNTIVAQVKIGPGGATLA